jgi:hypothetical protein
MTPFSTLRRIGAPLISAAATALVFSGALWMQHARGGWPFNATPSTPKVEGMAGMQVTSGADATHSRVPIEASAARSLDIRLETVGRQSLTENVRAVATIVPDASLMCIRVCRAGLNIWTSTPPARSSERDSR